MFGLPGLRQPLRIGGFGPSVAGEKLHLAGDDAIQERRRLQGLLLRLGVVYGPPAVQAEVVALQRGGHLHAAVAGYAVEVMLVALISAAHGPVQPEAGLDSAAAHEMVALAGQGLVGMILREHGCTKIGRRMIKR